MYIHCTLKKIEKHDGKYTLVTFNDSMNFSLSIDQSIMTGNDIVGLIDLCPTYMGKSKKKYYLSWLKKKVYEIT